MPAYFVVNEADSQKATAESRYEVAPLTIPAPFVTAANAMASAVVATPGIGIGGITALNYQHDIISTPVSAQANSDVRSTFNESV